MARVNPWPTRFKLTFDSHDRDLGGSEYGDEGDADCDFVFLKRLRLNISMSTNVANSGRRSVRWAI